MDSKEIKNRLREHYNYIKSLGYEIVAVFLQGGFNFYSSKIAIMLAADKIINKN